MIEYLEERLGIAAADAVGTVAPDAVDITDDAVAPRVVVTVDPTVEPVVESSESLSSNGDVASSSDSFFGISISAVRMIDAEANGRDAMSFISYLRLCCVRRVS